MKTGRIICFVVAVGVIVGGLIGCLLASRIVTYIMKTQVTLGPKSPAEPFWESIPAPLETKVYLFNVSNAKSVQESGAKPILNEMGPYHFDEYHKKVKIFWNDNDTVTYQNVRTYLHDNFRSKANIESPVTILNAPAATLSSLASTLSGLEKGLLNMFVQSIKEPLFTKQRPADIVFNGYEDPLLSAVTELSKLGISFPGEMDKFGIFYQRNNTDWFDGVFNMFTGKKNLSLANKMYSWNYTKHTSFFPGKCGDVRGNAEMFTPLEGPTPFVELYSNDLCRPMTLHNVGTSRVKGVNGVRYEILPSFLANRTVNKDNWCFDGGREWPSGIYNASTCRFNAPVFISQPHFLQADPFYVNQFVGGSLKPNSSQHQTYFVIDPVSGIPLEVVARFQVNFFMDKLKGLDLFKHLKGPIIFPAFWFETKMTITDDMKIQLWLVSNMQAVIVGMSLSACLVTVAILIVIAIRDCVIASSDVPETSYTSLVAEGRSDVESTDSSNALISNEQQPATDPSQDQE